MSRYIILLLIMGIQACGDGLTKVKDYDENGVLTTEYTIDADGFKQGWLMTYYDNGKDTFEKAEYLDDRLHGTRTLYYPSGKPEIEEHYLQDIITDTLYLYYENGNIKMKSLFDMGVHRGINLAYYESGAIKEEVTFEDNMEKGPFVEYHENGRVHWQGQYLNGPNEYGELQEYNEQGELIKRMLCDSLGICATTWTITTGDIEPTYVR